MNIERYQKLLADHLRFIEKSAFEFDRGDTSEALRIATSLRVIFHQTAKSKALLEHLNAWDIRLLTANKIDLKGLKEDVPDAPLAIIEWSIYPDTNVSQTNDEYITVKKWWDEDPVTATLGHWITRKDIVMWVANKDGGAHVDGILPQNYIFSMDSGTFAVLDRITGEVLQRQIKTPLLKLRQIAHEVLNSSDLFKLADKVFVAKHDSVCTLYNTGFALVNTGRNQEALDAFNKTLERKPDYAIAWHFKGIALMNLGRDQEALVAFDKALAINPDNTATLYSKGATLCIRGRDQEALGVFDKALSINPDYANAWCGKGVVLGRFTRDQEALEAFDKALAINPDYANAWCGKGSALCNLGKSQEALEAFDKALAINPDFTDALNNKGMSLGRLGRHEGALNAFNKALDINPDYIDAWHYKSIALGNLGRHEEAKDCADRARDLKNRQY
jgi:tetratricopeptide (TPR) repeat protein